jgi:glycerophosphoryl diester phosphodiesterase
VAVPRAPFPSTPRPFLAGHRGAAGEAPENTLAAFRCGVTAGAEVIETDVRLSSDGVVVCCHDDTVDRTTDGVGEVARLSAAALGRLDAGARFTSDGGRTFPWRGRGESVATLAAALEALPGARFNVELKGDDPRLARAVVDLLAASGRAPDVLVSGSDDGLLAEATRAAEASGVPLAVGMGEEGVRACLAAAARGRPPPRVAPLQLPYEHEGTWLVTPALVAWAHAHGLEVYTWTVNDPGALRRLLAAGVDGVVSDVPSRLRPLLPHGQLPTGDPRPGRAAGERRGAGPAGL